MKAETKFIREVQKTALSQEFQNKHIMNPEKDFKRNRKLTFSDVIMYIIGNTKNSIGLAAERFSKHLNCEKISAAAMCKARAKVKYTAFEELFENTAEHAPRNKKFHGYSLIAVDGMKGELPKTPEFTEKYRVSGQSDMPVFHAVSACDVLNEIFISSAFHFGTANERQLACDLIESVTQKEAYRKESQIWIFDRGFPSLVLLQTLMRYDLKYVMRVSKSFLTEVNDFRKSKYVDRVVHVEYSDQRKTANHVESNGICNFDIRCVRVKLPSGVDEILITNLEREDFPKRDIKEIYRLRWGIETSYNYLKNAVFIEEFTSRSENGVMQDYYVSLLVHNFITCICGSLHEDIPKKEN